MGTATRIIQVSAPARRPLPHAEHRCRCNAAEQSRALWASSRSVLRNTVRITRTVPALLEEHRESIPQSMDPRRAILRPSAFPGRSDATRAGCAGPPRYPATGNNRSTRCRLGRCSLPGPDALTRSRVLLQGRARRLDRRSRRQSCTFRLPPRPNDLRRAWSANASSEKRRYMQSSLPDREEVSISSTVGNEGPTPVARSARPVNAMVRCSSRRRWRAHDGQGRARGQHAARAPHRRPFATDQWRARW
jgi:hypothetical protein